MRMVCKVFDTLSHVMGARLLHTLWRNADELRDEVDRGC